LFLQVDPHTVDVNIHPHKTEIRFYDERAISEFLVRSIRRSLLAKDAVPDSIEIARTEEKTGTAAEFETDESVKPLVSNAFSYVIDGSGLPLTDKKTAAENLFARLREENSTKTVQEEIIPYGADLQQKPEKPRFLFSSLTVIGEAFATYIIAKDEAKLYLIDQHAAHERVLFEKLLKRFNGAETASQTLLTPILLQMTAARRMASADKLQLLEDVGFAVEEFGSGDLILREIPSCMTLQEAEDFAVSVLEQDGVRASDPQVKREELTSNACKAAIKGGDRIDMAEMLELMRSLDGCENPFSCPHGRPTLISFSLSDIERQFKRK
jgi:DNA mismatch repair protein MutL